jgi:hypothetical protein
MLAHSRYRDRADNPRTVFSIVLVGNKIAELPWAADIVTAWERISALPRAP